MRWTGRAGNLKGATLEQRCEKQVRLSDSLAKAVQDVSSAKADEARAITQKLDVAPYSEVLAEARAAERLAVKVLELHKREHGC